MTTNEQSIQQKSHWKKKKKKTLLTVENCNCSTHSIKIIHNFNFLIKMALERYCGSELVALVALISSTLQSQLPRSFSLNLFHHVVLISPF